MNALGLLAWTALHGAVVASQGIPWKQYERPEEAGFSAPALEEARAFAESIGSASVFVASRGHAVAAWGEVERRFECYSVRKSLVSALVGTEVDAKRIQLDATLAELGIDDTPPLTEAEKKATLRQLLMSRSGVYHGAAKEPADMKSERPARGSSAPGERHWYNNWDFNAVGIAFERTSGKKLFEEFERRLARPLGMEDFRAADGTWQLEPSSSIHAAYAFQVSARDLARIGVLYARNGAWNGERILSEEWIALSTAKHSDAGNGRGYGYMWWVYPKGSFGDGTQLDAHDKFAAVGTGGQFLLVVPAIDFVLVHQADTRNGRKVRGGPVWELAERVLDARSGDPEPQPTLVALAPRRFADALPAPAERTAIALDAAALPAFVGEYENEGAPKLRVKVHVWEGRLFAFAQGEGEEELHMEAPDAFFAPHANVQVKFRRDAQNVVTHADLTLEGQTMSLRRAN